LVHTGPTLDTVLWTDGVRFIQLDPIDFTWADLSTVSTALALFWINYRIHHLNSHRAWRIAFKHKLYLKKKLYALCPMRYAILTNLFGSTG
jgi:hypothetical protein